MTAPPTLSVVSLGTVPYGEALALQRTVALARIDGTLKDDLLILLEHPPVVTIGRSTDRAHLLADERSLARHGIDFFEVERGGDVTFHGPGQLVGYPIIDLRAHREDLHWYLRQLEAVLITALASLGIVAERRAGLTGVWTHGRKVASIGVHAKQWVTWHGFALNVTTDLSQFSTIVPCGIEGVEMTSVARELGSSTHDAESLMSRVSDAVVVAFADTFHLQAETVAAERLQSFAPLAVSPP